MVKGFPCDFSPDVVCSHKKCACRINPAVCLHLKCSHIGNFMSEMDDEEERFFDEVERLEKEREVSLRWRRRLRK